MASFLTDRRLPNYPRKYTSVNRTLRDSLQVAFFKDKASFITNVEDPFYPCSKVVRLSAHLKLPSPSFRDRAWFYGSIKAGAFTTLSGYSDRLDTHYLYQSEHEELISRNSLVLPVYQHDRRLGTNFSEDLDCKLQDALLKWKDQHIFSDVPSGDCPSWKDLMANA